TSNRLQIGPAIRIRGMHVFVSSGNVGHEPLVELPRLVGRHELSEHLSLRRVIAPSRRGATAHGAARVGSAGRRGGTDRSGSPCSAGEPSLPRSLFGIPSRIASRTVKEALYKRFQRDLRPDLA